MKIQNEDIGFFIKKISNHIEREMFIQYKKHNIKEYSLMNIMLINYLTNSENHQDIFQKNIEEEFHINKATASKMLSLMEEKKLIKRVPFENDSRLKKILVLPKGRELQLIGIKIIESLENKLKKDISFEELEVFKKVCKKIIKNMD